MPPTDFPVAYRESNGVDPPRILCLECGEGFKDVLCDDHPDALDWYAELDEDEVDAGARCAECGVSIFD